MALYVANHLKRKQATGEPDFVRGDTKSLEGLEVGKKSELQLSKASSLGILPQLGC